MSWMGLHGETGTPGPLPHRLLKPTLLQVSTPGISAPPPFLSTEPNPAQCLWPCHKPTTSRKPILMTAGILALPIVSYLITWLQLLTASCHMLLGLSLFTETLTRAGQSILT